MCSFETVEIILVLYIGNNIGPLVYGKGSGNVCIGTETQMHRKRKNLYHDVEIKDLVKVCFAIEM